MLQVSTFCAVHELDPWKLTILLNASQRGIGTLKSGASWVLVLISLLFSSALLFFLLNIVCYLEDNKLKST